MVKSNINKIILLITLTAVLAVGFLVWNYLKEEPEATVTSFKQCADAGHTVMESYPRQCKIPDGETFVEDIGNELEKIDLIRISNPRPNDAIESPVEIAGEARGYWFFEADFPIRLLDENGEELGIAIARTSSEWMTEDFIPFSAVLEFQTPTTNMGMLILEKDNPSGLPENADELRIPIRFGKKEAIETELEKETESETVLAKTGFSLTLPPGWEEVLAQGEVLALAIDTREEIANESNFQTNLSIKSDDLEKYTQEYTMQEYTDVIKSALTEEVPSIKFTYEEASTINDNEAFFIECESTQEEINYSTLLVFIKEKNNILWALSFNTFESSWSTYQGLFYQMAESFQTRYQIEF